MKIAIEGCAHGELDKIYEGIQYLEKKDNIKVDLLICCGDFEAARNESDLQCLHAPEKYLHLKSFYKYYSGEKVAPIPTIFIGGNHEAINHLWELYYGGWVAPNIYYLGHSGVVHFGGLRIAGISGIYKHHDFYKGYYERLPYSMGEKVSAYHVRQYEVSKLLQIKEPIDIFISHDWPTGITQHGDYHKLLSVKPFLQPDIESGRLGSPAADQLLRALKPTFWFSAHLHVKFPAVFRHGDGEDAKMTKFLALDKCLPHRDYLQVIDVPGGEPRTAATTAHAQPLENNSNNNNNNNNNNEGPVGSPSYPFRYDEEWLAILRAAQPYFPLEEVITKPIPQSLDTTKEREWVQQRRSSFKDGKYKDLDIPHNFVITAPPHHPGGGGAASYHRRPPLPTTTDNVQTREFLEFMELPNVIALDHAAAKQKQQQQRQQPYGYQFQQQQQRQQQQEQGQQQYWQQQQQQYHNQSYDNEEEIDISNPEEIDIDFEAIEEQQQHEDQSASEENMAKVARTSGDEEQVSATSAPVAAAPVVQQRQQQTQTRPRMQLPPPVAKPTSTTTATQHAQHQQQALQQNAVADANPEEIDIGNI